MKISNPEIIEESEKEFIDLINAELDWEVIEKLLLEKHSFTLQEEVEYKNGDIVVHNDSIAYKFDFNIKVPLSIIFSREGEFLEISTSQPDDADELDDNNESIDDVEKADIEDIKKSKSASDIADMISEINQED
ncbi:MAG: hypothetical protein KAJ62_09425 [Desulfobacteraceae bacterium]|nr:hypothetical protein [Desulfobacteraceae bacterium]